MMNYRKEHLLNVKNKKLNFHLTTVSTCQRYVTILAVSAVSKWEEKYNWRKNRAITRCWVNKCCAYIRSNTWILLAQS